MPLPALVLVVVVLVNMAASVTWRAMGNTLYFDATPSMCPSLCVGALVIDEPLGNASLHVGETITFHPPGVAQVFTHRVYRVLDGGTSFKTKGIAVSRPDPWTITRADVEGVTVASVWGLGWFLRALSFMAVGVIALLFTRRYIAARSRRDTDRLFATLIVALPIAMMRPMLGSYVVSATTTATKGVDAVRLINTGLLPAQFHAVHGTSVTHVAPGQTAIVSGPPAPNVGVPFRQFASLYWWEWLIGLAILLVPVISFIFDALWAKYYVSDAHESLDEPLALVTTADAGGSVGNGAALRGGSTRPVAPS